MKPLIAGLTALPAEPRPDQPPAVVGAILPHLEPAVLPTDDEERDELEAVLHPAAPDAPPMAPAELDAYASELLRLAGEAQADADRYSAAEDLEVDRIQARYATLIDRAEGRARRLLEAVEALALRADFGKKKSRDVGYGSYGLRKHPDKFGIVAREPAHAWAEANLPSALVTTVAVELDRKAIYDHFRATGELPPGCEYTAGAVKPFAKLEPLTP